MIIKRDIIDRLKENRKFIFNVIKSGARSKDYEDALTWLKDAGVIYIIYDVSKPGHPLSGYKESNAFKVYACDVGLLRRLARLDASNVVAPVAGHRIQGCHGREYHIAVHNGQPGV